MTFKKVSLLVILLLFLASSLVSFLPQQANAAFNNNNVMSDTVFDDSGSMSTSQIQNFLNGFPSSCLKNYKSGYPQSYSTYGSSVPASQIIRRAADLWHINPRVILATLEKEEGLVSGGSGCASWRYNSAMGMGCPDGGACPAPGYAGFSHQVTKGSWQLKFSKERAYGDLAWDGDGNVHYYGYMTKGNRARSSSESSQYYDGYATIDGKSVYMTNGATAALYTYTPHFHGNQNFVTIFSKWFGSTQSTELVRTTKNKTVYLLSDDNKYPVLDQDMLNDLSVFGPVSFVSQSLIDGKTTGPAMNRAVKSTDGSTVYFTSAGYKLPFPSCSLLTDYGLSCGNVITLTDAQISRLGLGSNMTNLYQTTAGSSYYVKNDLRHEVFDNQSLQNAGISGSYNKLYASGVADIPLSTPIIRDNVIAKSNNSGWSYLYYNDGFTYIPSDLVGSKAFVSFPKKTMQGGSISSYPITRSFVGFAQNSGGDKYIIDLNGKTLLSSPASWSSGFTNLNDSLLSQAPNSTQPTNSMFIRSSSNSTIYLINGVKKHKISSWDDFIGLHLDRSSKYSLLQNPTINSISDGAQAIAPGSLIKSPYSSTVYIVSGLFQKSALPDFAISNDLGLKTLTTIHTPDLAAYTSTSSAKSFVMCNGKKYIGNEGKLYEVTSQIATDYGWTSASYVTWDSYACNNVQFAHNALPGFIQSQGGKTIYKAKDGAKHPITSYATYKSLGGSSSNTLIVSNYFAGLIQTGTPL